MTLEVDIRSLLDDARVQAVAQRERHLRGVVDAEHPGALLLAERNPLVRRLARQDEAVVGGGRGEREGAGGGVPIGADRHSPTFQRNSVLQC